MVKDRELFGQAAVHVGGLLADRSITAVDAPK